MHEECRGLSTLPPGSVPSIGGAFQQLGMAMGGAERGWNVPREAGCPQGQAAGSDVFRSSTPRESVIGVSFEPRSNATVLGF